MAKDTVRAVRRDTSASQVVDRFVMLDSVLAFDKVVEKFLNMIVAKL